MEKNNYNSEIMKQKYNFLTDDMLYNIILNLRYNNMSFDDLADNMGLTVEELLFYLTEKNKDFFVCLEGISFFEEKGIYKDYGRLKTNSSDDKSVKL